jgi:hypothetical protein
MQHVAQQIAQQIIWVIGNSGEISNAYSPHSIEPIDLGSTNFSSKSAQTPDLSAFSSA